jgi:hypothetical protein
VRRALVRAAGALLLAALLVGPSAEARSPHVSRPLPHPSAGHTTNEWLMMGRNCGASIGVG